MDDLVGGSFRRGRIDIIGARTKHLLKINSLRDLQAECSCGKWSLTSHAFDSDSDDFLVNKAITEFGYHAERYALPAPNPEIV